jgi:hypothetical protein
MSGAIGFGVSTAAESSQRPGDELLDGRRGHVEPAGDLYVGQGRLARKAELEKDDQPFPPVESFEAAADRFALFPRRQRLLGRDTLVAD